MNVHVNVDKRTSFTVKTNPFPPKSNQNENEATEKKKYIMHAAIKLTQSQLLNPYKLHNTQHNRSSRTLRAIHNTLTNRKQRATANFIQAVMKKLKE